MMLEEIRIADERMKSSIIEERRTHISHSVSPPTPSSMYNSLAYWAFGPF